MASARYFIGLMSGTSADALDAVLVSPGTPPTLIATHSLPLGTDLQQRIHTLCLPGDNEIEQLGSLDIELAEVSARAVNTLLAKANIDKSQVVAIGSHGQTLRHRPPRAGFNARPFSLQIGDPNTLAYLTGVTTVADFRRRDIAAGGQGAPLVPGFHRALFAPAPDQGNRAVLNIGGIANVTLLHETGETLGFDTGPGNTLLDAWIQHHKQRAFDKDGAWAATGKPHAALLQQLLKHPFLAQPAPKSTGREEFNLPWLRQQLQELGENLPTADVQASLLQLTAQSIAQALKNALAPNGKTLSEIIVCGGGAYNGQLLEALRAALPLVQVTTSTDWGIAPEWIEAMAFAWLAEQTLKRQPGNVKAVTGARNEVILGGVYYP